MNFKELTELIKLIDKSDLAEFQYKTDQVDIKIRNNKYYKNATQITAVAPMVSAPQVAAPAPAPVAAAPSAPAPAPTADVKLLEVKSPMVGTFYRSPGPDKPPFVQVGDNIAAGSPVCIIEAMKLFNEIESEVTGKIVKVLVEDATPVEYDQVLFLVEP
ncbi:MAG: acetyl-CoA carboxylase biotin carboxyl carrier protein [Saprospiraceae bacterium]|nr:acetyl-CoA carboxylase biotin carboxyl carrier protein [Saprospiraceae bacterium]